MFRNLTVIGTAVVSIIISAANAPAIGQAGSTGGVIGNTNKSVSGSAEPSAAPSRKRTASPREKSSGHSCKIVGTWSWYLGVSSVIFQKDGSARHPASGTSGKWTCSGDAASVVWSTDGTTRTDRITISQDGDSILVVSPYGGGIKFTGSRRD